jgi:RHS repeat-associated protein
MSADATWSYAYDKEGNVKKKINGSGVTWKYVYSANNNLTQAKRWSEDPDVYGTAVLQKQLDYEYNAFGLKMEQVIDADGSGAGSAVTMRFAYEGWNAAKRGGIGRENFDVLADIDGNGSLTTHYIRGDRVDELIARADGASPRWYLNDRLGSVRDIIDNGAVLKDSIKYTGFGIITSETTPAERGRYTWTSREYEAESELQYNRARWYDPKMGRWISQDPLGFGAGDSNLYRYVRNRSVNTADPSGLDSIEFRADGAHWVSDNGKDSMYLGRAYTYRVPVIDSVWDETIVFKDEWNWKKTTEINYSIVNRFVKGARENDIWELDEQSRKWILQDFVAHPELSQLLIDKASFLAWHKRERAGGLMWLKSIDQPPNMLRKAEAGHHPLTRVVGFVPPPGWEWDWKVAMGTPMYYHPNATYGIRKKGTGDAGAQAMYDKYGMIITEGVSAGTADKISPEISVSGHRKADVIPFDWARALDKHYGGSRYRNLYYEVRPPNVRDDAPPNRID